MLAARACTQKEGNAHLRLSKAIYNFTDTQDLRLAVGYRATVDEKGAISGVRAVPTSSATDCSAEHGAVVWTSPVSQTKMRTALFAHCHVWPVS